ncbi:hypothetical protein HDV01_003639 [Terramyces sp. JEL0728]|nr:hypothetical protein HDV01_003639 [Terramyces sp. JEL0728]
MFGRKVARFYTTNRIHICKIAGTITGDGSAAKPFNTVPLDKANAEIYIRQSLDTEYQPISKSGLKKELKWAKIYLTKLEKAQQGNTAGKEQISRNPSFDSNLKLFENSTRTRINNASKFIDGKVKIAGWVHRQRVQGKKMKFIVLRDGYGYLQCVVGSKLCADVKMQDLTLESSIELHGTIRKVPEGKQAPNGIELKVEDFNVISMAPGGDSAFGNILNTESSPGVLLDNRHLVLRGETASSSMKFRSMALKAFRDYFDSNLLAEVNPPLLVETQAEGGSNVFTVDYYGKNAYLTQSSQLYLETMLPVVGDNYCITESFRAENSVTRRHLSQFTHVEAELGFINFNRLLDFIEDMLVAVTKSLMDDPQSALIIKELNPNFTPPLKPFMRMEYQDAIQWLCDHNIQKDIYVDDVKVRQEPYRFGDDIVESAERKMTDTIGQPILLTKFPVELKAFYMKKCISDPRLTESVDILMPGIGEITGAILRKETTARQRKYKLAGYFFILVITGALTYFGARQLIYSSNASNDSAANTKSNKLLANDSTQNVSRVPDASTWVIPADDDRDDQLPTVLGLPLTSIVSDVSAAQSAYNLYKAQFGKSNPPADETWRLTLFTKHVQWLNAFNAGKVSIGPLNILSVANNPSSLKLGLNQFSDWSRHAYKAMLTAKPSGPASAAVSKGTTGDLPIQLATKPSATVTSPTVPLAQSSSVPIVNLKKRGTPPSAWDWRNYGLVTSVKNQNTLYLTCNSCVMFAVAATYEAFGPMTGGAFQDLSAQQILDCYTQDYSVCADGSSLSYAFQNLMGSSQLALSSASYYPYVGYQSYCQTPQKTFPLYGFSWGTGESSLLQQVYQQPVAALIDASCVEFQYYSSGILTYTGCTNTPNHAVAIIGYGTDAYYGQYWIGKNSWGTTWGESGYFRFQMGHNYLSIASTYFFFPTNYGNYIQNPSGSNVYLNSPNGIMAPDMNSWMEFKADGSLSVYNRQNQMIWSSYSGGIGYAPYRLYLQYDGDLCIYDYYGTRTWCSTYVSSASAVYQLSMQNSGSLVVTLNGNSIWSTNTYVPL